MKNTTLESDQAMAQEVDMELAFSPTSQLPPLSPSPSHPFNPQVFVDDVFNAANDILEEGFVIMEENAPRLLGISGAESLEALMKGFDTVFNTVQGKLEKNLNRWEAYCLANCFKAPHQPSTFPEEANEDCLMNASAMAKSKEEELDAELDALRSQLVAAGKESAKMRRELRSLERCFAMKKRNEEALHDAVKPLEEDNGQLMMEEMLRTANTLREKLMRLKAERLQSPRGIRRRKSGFSPKDLRTKDLQHVIVQSLNI